MNHSQDNAIGLLEKLVGSSPIVPVQIEGVYTKALLDTGAQVTLLYRDFYDKHLSHIPLRKLEEFEIWEIGTAKCPYDGYIPILISFGPAAVGPKLSMSWQLCVLGHQEPLCIFHCGSEEEKWVPPYVH